MRLLLDLTPIQTSSSADRGIGRYSFMLAQALAKKSRNHDIRIILSAEYKESLENAKSLAEKITPSSHITLYKTGLEAFEDSQNIAAQTIRSSIYRHHIASLCPDALHICSLFEGATFPGLAPFDLDKLYPTLTGSTLYDIIPILYSEQYVNQSSKKIIEYFYKQYSKHDLVACISESARQDGLSHIGLKSHQSISIMGDVDPIFKIIPNAQEIWKKESRRIGINKDFILYTGGHDFRKNINALIEAYSLMSEKIRTSHQLVIVCKLNSSQRADLISYAKKRGLHKSLVLTGFVSDHDLVLLKNSCKLFVFPSLYEGFGMPVLEAMRCGAPVIGSDRSSIPEIISRKDALFDPTDPNVISKSIEKALLNDNFRASLVESGMKSASRFSWEVSASRLWDGYEAAYDRRMSELADKRIAITMASPMPPEKTGIANYTSNFLESINQKNQINIIKENGKKEINEDDAFYDERTVYQFGNSSFHWRMWDKIIQNSGIMVQHDIYLGGLVNWMESSLNRPGFFHKILTSSNDFNFDPENTYDRSFEIDNFPMSRPIIEASNGVFVHSEFAKNLILQNYPDIKTRIIKMPQIRNLEPKMNKDKINNIRKKYNLDEHYPIIISSGFVHQIKLADEMISAFESLCKIWPNSKFIFLGQVADNLSNNSLSILKKYGQQICITGYLDDESFQDHIACSDIAVQFRRTTRGETSRAVLDAMAHGTPLIINDVGSMSEISSKAALILKGIPSPKEISEAIKNIWENKEKMQKMQKGARNFIKNNNNMNLVSHIFVSNINRINYDIKQKNLKNRLREISDYINKYKIKTNNFFISESLFYNSDIKNVDIEINKFK